MLPKVIGPINPSGSDLKGIIYEIKEKYGITNPVKRKIVLANSSGNKENTHDAVILWDKKSWQSAPANNPWIQLDFPKGFIQPTAYSIRGVKPFDQRCFAKTWDVFGIYNNDENNKTKWIKLASNKSSETNFCKNTVKNACFDFSVGTYNLESMKSSKGFRHIRFVLTETVENEFCIGENNHYFATSGIDIYGTLYTFYSPCTIANTRRSYLFFLRIFVFC